MKTKWDIVEDVVSKHTSEQPSARLRQMARSIVSDALATTVFAGTLLLPVFALSTGMDVAQTGFFTSTRADSPFVWMKSDFTRPRLSRDKMAKSEVDVSVGMSTRRLAELHGKLFRPDETTYVDLTEEYSFL